MVIHLAVYHLPVTELGPSHFFPTSFRYWPTRRSWP